MGQRRLTNSFQPGLVPLFPPCPLGGLLSGVSQLPGRDTGFAGEAGQAQVRMVSAKLLV